jgi:hypothetical protein
MIVAIAFILMGWMPLARLNIMRPANIPDVVLKVGVGCACGAFLIRGVIGFAQQLIWPAASGMPYIRLNRILYSPISLVVAVLLFLSMRDS